MIDQSYSNITYEVHLSKGGFRIFDSLEKAHEWASVAFIKEKDMEYNIYRKTEKQELVWMRG